MRRGWIGMLVLTGLGVGGPAAAQDREPAVVVAEEFVGLLRSGDFAGAAALVSAAIPPGQLGAPQLESVWGQVSAGVGSLDSVRLRQVVTAMDTLRVVELLGGFERQPLILRVAVAPDRKVVGFFIVPVPPTEQAQAATAADPAYADRTRIREEEVVVGADPWRLPGTLTVPAREGRHPAVVLVHGSGPNDRDETVGGVKVFRDIALGLATRGIAVLRYDKRTRVHGARMGPDVTLDAEVVDDALAALRLLRSHPSIDPARVYVVGHSLGGLLAPEIARRDGGVAGVVLLAAPARRMDAVLLSQFEHLAGLEENAAPAAQEQFAIARAQVERAVSGAAADTATILGAPVRYWRELMAVDAVAAALASSAPVLVLHGERDYQVTLDDYRIWSDRAGSRPNVTVRLMPGLNHLFVTGTGVSRPAEYTAPAHVDRSLIDAVAGWLDR